ncbi:hypothetical protein ABK040_011351 [Willaertia magna]
MLEVGEGEKKYSSSNFIKDLSKVDNTLSEIDNGRTSSSISSGIKNSDSTIQDTLFNLIYLSRCYNIKMKGVLEAFFQVLIFIQTIALCTFHEYHYGEYGSWVMRAINFLYTFGFDALPYSGHVVIAFLIYTLEALYIINFLFTRSSVETGSRYWDKITLIGKVLSVIVVVLGPANMYILGSFLHCNYEKMVLDEETDTHYYSLYAFKDVQCFGAFNISLLVLSIVAAFIYVVISILSVFALVNFRTKCQRLFVISSPLCHVFLVVSNITFAYLQQVIPPIVYYIVPTIYCLKTVGCLLLFLWELPYYRRMENSFVVSLLVGCLGFSSVTIVASVTNTERSFSIGLMLMGISLGSFLILFVISFFLMEIITRVMVRYSRSRLKLVCKENIPFDTFPQFLLKNFITWSTRNNSDRELVTSFITIACNRRYELNVKSLIICSQLVIYYFDDSLALGYYLLKNTGKHRLNFWDKFHIFIRRRCYDKKENINFEVNRVLDNARKYQEKIVMLQKSFWKQIMSDDFTSNTVMTIMSKLTSLHRKVNSMFENLIANTVSQNKTVLREYGKYLGDLVFDKKKAIELFEESNSIEEEESKKKTFIPKSRSGNRIVPATSIRYQVPTSPSPSTTFFNNDKPLDEIDGDDNNSLASANEYVTSADRTKEMYRNAINRKNRTKVFSVFGILSIFVFSLMVIITTLALNITTSSYQDKMPIIANACSMCTLPYAITHELRSIQRYLLLRPNESLTYISEASGRLSFYKNTMNKMIEFTQSNSFSGDMKTFWIETNKVIRIPVKQNKGGDKLIYVYKNSSVAEILRQSVTGIEYTLSYSVAEYNQTLDNFFFLYFWLNAKSFSSYFQAFCDTYVTNNEKEVRYNLNAIIGAVCGILSSFLLFSLFYLVVSGLIYYKTFVKLVKLFSFIPKGECGKIYHALDKKSSVDVKVENSITDNLTSSRCLPLSALVIILITLVACALLLVEYSSNMSTNLRAIHKIRHGTRMGQIVNRGTFKLGELIMDHQQQLLEFNTSVYYNDVSGLIEDFMQEWNSFRFGTAEEGYFSVFGLDDTVDKLISFGHTQHATGHCKNVSIVNVAPKDMVCLSIDEIIDYTVTHVDQLYNDLYFKYYDKPTALERLEIQNIAGRTASTKIGQVLFELIRVFQRTSQQRVLSGVVCAISFLIIIVVAVIRTNIHLSLEDQRRVLRKMFHFVPCEVLDNIEEIRSYLLYDTFSTGSKKNTIANLLEKAQKELNAIVQAAVDGVIICNMEGDVERFNKAAEVMFGHKDMDIVGLPLTTLFSKECVEKVESVLQRFKVSAVSISETFELDAKRKSKNKFPVRVSLSLSFIEGSNEAKRGIISCYVKDITQELKYNKLINAEKTKSEALLLNILPLPVANRLKSGEKNIYENFKDVTCFFSDIVGFTAMSSKLEPNQVIIMLNGIVNEFDNLVEKFDLEKIKTIGDAYFCCGGLHQNKSSDHPEAVVKFAISTLDAIFHYNVENNTLINIRVGIHTGSVVAGVLGTKKFAYDIFGDAVNTASRMESTGVPGRIQVSRATYERIHDLFEFEEKSVEAKGKGTMKTYLLNKKHHQNPVDTANKENIKNQQITLENQSSVMDLFTRRFSIDNQSVCEED